MTLSTPRPHEEPRDGSQVLLMGDRDRRLLDELAALLVCNDVLERQLTIVGTVATLYQRELRKLREITEALSHD
jgi:hypothetical protein